MQIADTVVTLVQSLYAIRYYCTPPFYACSYRHAATLTQSTYSTLALAPPLQHYPPLLLLPVLLALVLCRQYHCSEAGAWPCVTSPARPRAEALDDKWVLREGLLDLVFDTRLFFGAFR